MAYRKLSDEWRGEITARTLGGLVTLGGLSGGSSIQAPSAGHASESQVGALVAPKPPKVPKVDAQRGDSVWSDTEEERAAIAEYDGGAPQPWAEALARLDPARVPPSISQERWAQFVDDCGRFLDQGWATHAGGLGCGPLDLFGCDRERPPADDDHAGLLWRVEGGKLVIMSAYSAIIETTTGQQRLFHRRNNRPGELALAWEMTPGEIKA